MVVPITQWGLQELGTPGQGLVKRGVRGTRKAARGLEEVIRELAGGTVGGLTGKDVDFSRSPAREASSPSSFEGSAGPGRGGPAGSGREGGVGTKLSTADILGLSDQVNQNVERTALPPAPAAGGPGGPPGGSGIDDILSQLGGSYDAEIAALRAGGQRLGGLTQDLIGNIRGSAGAAQGQIGGFYDYAAGQAQAGRPAIQGSYDTAAANVNQTYDQLASRIGGLPQATADAARAAGGSAAGSSVADRVALAAAPFAAAGEGARAATQGNLQQHSTAGQDYLTQLAAAAPSEAALQQGAVAGRANQAVTSAQMALAQAQADIESRVARTEGAKQRALLEYSSDVAGDTMKRQMDAADLLFKQQRNALQARELGQPPEVPADPTAGSGYEEFDAALQAANPATRQFGQELLPALDLARSEGFDFEHILNAVQPGGPTEEPNSFLGRLFGDETVTVDNSTAQTIQELVQQILAGEEDPLMHLPEGVQLEDIRRGLRRQAQ